ncbi:MAG TPA: hypothetical protein V6C65_13435 [Allocoleopsis sp.]
MMQAKMMQAIRPRELFSQFLLPLGLVIACVATIAWFQVPQLQQLNHQSQNATTAQIQAATESERVRLRVLQNTPTFGFDNLIADWVFLNFLQYFGDDVARDKSDYLLSPDYFKVILGRNPYFLETYTFLSTSSNIYAGKAEEAVAIAKKALQSLKPTAPKGSYYAWRQVAIDQLLFLGDPQAARQSFLTAAEWARIQGNTQVADLSQQTADFLQRNPNSRYAQIAAWSMVLTSAPDDRTRKVAVRRIEELGAQVKQNPDGAFSIVPPAQD